MGLGRTIERGLKRCIFRLVAQRGAAPSGDTALDLASVHRVLLVRANVRLAHLVLITPAIASLRQALPQARIDVLCDAGYGGLLAADPAVDAVVPIDRRIMRHPIALARLVRRLRTLRYDLVLECGRGGSVLGAALTSLSGGRHRVGGGAARDGRVFDARGPRGRRTQVDPLLDLLARLGVPPVGPDPCGCWSPARRVPPLGSGPSSRLSSRRAS